MRSLLFAFAVLGLSLTSCAGDEADDGAVPAEVRQPMLLTVLTPDDDDQLQFLTASRNLVAVPADFYRGKPWVGLTFEAGSEPGVDEPIEWTWGAVPDSLTFEYAPVGRLSEGPYDLVVIIYAGTELTDEIRDGDAFDFPFPSGNDVTTFTLDRSILRDGEPDFAAGMIRVNSDEQPEVEVANRWSTAEDTLEDRTNSMVNTYLILP